MPKPIEKCQKCGDPGPDLRLLWMACFYEMMELGIPLEKRPAFTNRDPGEPADFPPRSNIIAPGTNLKSRVGDVVPTGEYLFKEMYTLRVCKRCRSSWMEAIRQWFNEAPVSLGTGIFVRRGGASVEISEEEWARDNPGREPVRFKGE